MSTATTTVTNDELKMLYAFVKLSATKPRNKDIAEALQVGASTACTRLANTVKKLEAMFPDIVFPGTEGPDTPATPATATPKKTPKRKRATKADGETGSPTKKTKKAAAADAVETEESEEGENGEQVKGEGEEEQVSA